MDDFYFLERPYTIIKNIFIYLLDAIQLEIRNVNFNIDFEIQSGEIRILLYNITYILFIKGSILLNNLHSNHGIQIHHITLAPQ